MARDVRQERGFDGASLRAARERLGLSRAELARRLATGWDVVLQWETGQAHPRPRSIPAIAAAVGLSVDDLYGPRGGPLSLAERRVAAGLNQTDVAKALGVNRAAISRWERGSRPVPAKHRRAYHQLLGLKQGLDARAHEQTAPPQSAQTVSPSSPDTAAPGSDAAEMLGLNAHAASTPSRAAHLMVISDLTFRNGRFVGGVDAPRNWRVYSPQGIDVNKTASPILDQLMEEAALRLVRRGYQALCLHSEQRVIIDDEPVCVVRVQTSPPSDTRMHSSRLFLSTFTPDFYLERVGEDLEAKSRLRKEFEAVFPQTVSGETLFVIAEPTDPYGWLQDQTLPYVPYTIVSYLPDLKRQFMASVHYDHTSVKTDVGFVSLDALGIQRDTTVAEIAHRLQQYFHANRS